MPSHTDHTHQVGLVAHIDHQVGGGDCQTDPQLGGGGSIVLLQSSLLGIMWLKDK